MISNKILSKNISVTLSFKKGEVTVERKQKKLKAKNKMILMLKDKIKTGAKSLALIRIKTSNSTQTLKMEENSEIKLSQLSLSKQTTELMRGGTFLYLKSKLREKMKKPQVVLKTKSVSMAVRGTEFFASYGPKGFENDFWMCVNEGQVKVKTKDEKRGVIVNEGEGVQIKKGSSLEKPRPYEWTKKLNWNTNPKKGNIMNSVDLSDFYNDLLDVDYD